MRYLSPRYRLVVAVVFTAACASPVETPPEEAAPSVLTGPGPFAVSNAVALGGGGGGPQGSALPSPVAFLSLPPGALPGRTEVTIRTWRTGTVARGTLVDGGLDPVAVSAAAGDTLTVTATGPGVPPGTWTMTVPPRRPPRLVRTDPPPNKRDVALNLRIALVFSEPIEPAALRPDAISLRTGTAVVASTLAYGNAERTLVWLAPGGPLAPATEYVVSVETTVTDLDGEGLEAPVVLTFATGAEPPPASGILVSDVTDGRAFVSVPPGRWKAGWGTVTIRNERSGAVVEGPFIEGSLDPVAIAAVPGDVLAVEIPYLPFLGEPDPRQRVQVPAEAVPVVVRTGVSADEQGVALNPRIEVVFSEPVAVTAGGIALLGAGGTPLATRVTFADLAHTTVGLEPVARLSPGSGYRVLVGQGVTDRQGATIAGEVALPFTTAGRVPFEGLTFVRHGQIHVVEDGSVIQLTRAARTARHDRPAWSPDGARLAFEQATGIGTVGGPRDIYVLNMADSSSTRLTQGGGWEPAWSPDGRTIAYSRFQDGSQAIGLVSTTGGTSGTLINRPGYDALPTWSPDGRSLVFVSDWRAYDFLFDLYAVDANGDNVRTVYAGAFFSSSDPDTNLRLSFDPAWSPDGTEIAFAACASNYFDCFPSALAVLRMSAEPNEQGTRRLLARGNGIQRPAWSPDGTSIVFSVRDCATCVPSLRWVAADGRAEGLVLTNAYSPAWRPWRRSP